MCTFSADFVDKCGQAFSARKRLSSICLLAHSYDRHALAQWAHIVALFYMQPMQWQRPFTLLSITLHSPAKLNIAIVVMQSTSTV